MGTLSTDRWALCADAGVPEAYVKAAARVYDPFGQHDRDTLDLWLNDIPRDYAHALRSLPVPIIKLYWGRGVSMMDLYPYGIWGVEYKTFLPLHENGVPVSYSLPLLAEGMRSEDIIDAYNQGVPLDYAVALAGSS